jgi:hypothetical protein
MRKLFMLFLWSLLSLPTAGLAYNCYSQPIIIGVNTQGGDATLARGANIGWTRITIPWRDVNPAFGVYNWGAVDGPVNNALSQGLKVLGILSTAPQWAGSNDKGTTPPSNITYWETFVAETAKHFNGKIEAYEIWNEPNLINDSNGVGWNGDLWQTPRYVDYLRAAAIKIRTWAPGTLVVGPVTSSTPDSRTVEVFRQLEEVTFPDGPASNFVDVISFHANARDTETVTTIQSRITSQLNTLAARNWSNRFKPIWITEFGWPVNAVGEGTQRDRIRDLIASLLGIGPLDFSSCPINSNYKLTHAFIFLDIDNPNSSRGIYRQDRTPKFVTTNYLTAHPFPARENSAPFLPFTTSCVGRTCTFTSSQADTGTQVFDWDFGDGTFGSGRVVSHTYAAAGRYFIWSMIHEWQEDKFGNLMDIQLGSDTETVRVP